VGEALLPLLAMAAGVMLLAGVAKLRSPASTEEALGAFGLPQSAALARGVGTIEACIGGLCLIAPGPLAPGALALAYLTLAAAGGVHWLRGGRQAPCGCFGDSSAPIHLGHLALNIVCALVALAAAAQPPPVLRAILGQGLPAVVLLAGIGGSVYLIYALLTLLPDSWQAAGAGRGDGTA
jgi:uncharacterized membrane protein YphA (DoxX/SURF4 family)